MVGATRLAPGVDRPLTKLRHSAKPILWRAAKPQRTVSRIRSAEARLRRKPWICDSRCRLQGTRMMRRVAPILTLLALAACAGGPASTPTPAVAPGTARANPPRAMCHRQRMLSHGAAINRKWTNCSAPWPQGIGLQVHLWGPPFRLMAALPSAQALTPHPSAGATGEAFEASYEENLQTCLDGRFPAFCDHSKLSAYDAARVDTAEREANFVTCIDPQWQHLCRPELLPGSDTDPANSPNAGPP